MRFDEDGLYPIVTHAFNFVGKGALGMSRPVTVASRLRKVTDRALRWSLAQSLFLIGHVGPPCLDVLVVRHRSARGWRHRSPSKREKSRSVVIHSLPDSIASAAW